MNEREVFTAALHKHSREERAEFLSAACGADRALRERVESLLAEHGRLDGFLECTATGGSVSEPAPLEPAGMQIGPYKLLEPIGEGGMGVVYLAEQTAPVRRQVALKVIKPGMDTRQFIARFEAERQAMALMDHPNIAKVFDAGTTESGRPYLVMELIRGVPITDYCDKCALTPRQRLELFVAVCQGVQHAHQKGVIHRDIKPTNVLVTMQEGRPVPKIIDFGVAKALDQRLTEHSLLTGFSQIIGTPLYMSPEQAELSPLGVDTRADIYSLGALLYELLTGTTPFQKQRLKGASFDELRRILREEDPPRPSSRLSTTQHAALATIAMHRRSDPRRLSHSLQGDLDWIVMKCLEKDRSRRYDSASGLARDVERYLRDEPVLACPPSAAYRFAKFARRNRVVLTTTAIVAAALLITTVASAWSAVQALRHQQQLARTAADLQAANDQLEEAQQEALARLYQSNVAGARAQRWSRRPGRRFEALSALREAAALLPGLPLSPAERAASRQELRDEAIACLTLTDVRLQKALREGESEESVVVCDDEMSRYAVSDARGAIHVHRLSDDRILHRLPDDGPIAYRSLFSADGRHLLAKRDRGPLAFLHAYDLERSRSVWISDGFPARYGWAISRDGRRVAVGQQDNTISLLDVAFGQELERLPSAGVPPHSLAFRPDGAALAHATRAATQRSVLVWDLQRSEIAAHLDFPRDVRVLAWSADGRMLALGSGDHCAYVWTVDGTKPVVECRGHQAEVVDVSFNQAGDLLVTGSWDGTTRLWDPRTGRELLNMPDWRPCPQFAADDRSLKAGQGVWELAPGHECRIFPAHEALQTAKGPSDVAIDPGGGLLASCGADGVRLWSAREGREIAHLPIGPVASACFPDGQSLVTSGEGGQHRWPLRLDAETATLEVGPAELLGRLPVATRTFVDADGRTMALIADGQVQLVELARRQPPRLLASRANLVDPAISPDGRWAAAGSWHGRGVRLWDAHRGRVVKDLLIDLRHVHVAFSPDGRWLVTGSGREYRFWRVDDWQPAHTIPRKAAGSLPGRMAFTSDGGLLAIALSRQVIQLVDPETGKALATLQPLEPGEIRSMSFSGDGATLAVATANRHLQVWDLREIRRRLCELDLDWDGPPLPPPTPAAPVRQAIVNLGEVEPPLTAGELLERANLSARRGQWEQAAADFSVGLKGAPDRHWPWLQSACLHFFLGQLDEHRQHCRQMLDRFADAPDPFIRERAAKVCLIAPMGGDLTRRAAELADGLVEGTEEHGGYQYFTLLKGMAEYRLGRFDEAVPWLEAGEERLTHPALRALSRLFLAMACAQRGEQAAAHEWFAAACALIDAELPPPDSPRQTESWHDCLVCFAVRREAEALLSAPPPSASPTPTDSEAASADNRRGEIP